MALSILQTKQSRFLGCLNVTSFILLLSFSLCDFYPLCILLNEHGSMASMKVDKWAFVKSTIDSSCLSLSWKEWKTFLFNWLMLQMIQKLFCLEILTKIQRSANGKIHEKSILMNNYFLCWPLKWEQNVQ